MLRKLGRLTPENRRRLVAMGDQAASSLTNVLVAVLVMSAVSQTEFGAFALAMVLYQIAIGVDRALVGEPFFARHADEPREVRAGLVAELVGAALSVGLVGGAIVSVIGVAVGGLAGSGMVALAPVLPFLLVHDSLRFAFIVDRPGRALAIDVSWLVFVVMVVLAAPADAGASWYVTAWGVAGAAAMVLGLVLAQASHWRVHLLAWLRRTRQDGMRYAGDFLTAQAANYAAVLALGAVSSLATLGAVRASQTFYGPLNTVHLGIYLAVVPDGVRLRDRPGRLRRLMVLTSGGLALLAVCWALVGLGIPDTLGGEVFGDSWPGADELMIPMGLSMVFGGVTAGGFLGLRSLGDAQGSLRSRVLSVPGLLVLPIVGALAGGAVGFAFGAAAGRLLASGIWWSAFEGALRRRPVPVAPDGQSAAAAADAVLEGAVADDA